MTFHHPMFSNEPARNNPAQRAAWLPIFERYGVDLVLQGHDHSYARGNVVAGSTTQSGNGTMYVVSVSGPKMYEADDSNWVENGAVQRKMLTEHAALPGDQRRRRHADLQGADGDRAPARPVHDRQAGRQAKIITEDLANVQPEGVGGTVPATLSLTLGARRLVRRVHAGRRQGLRGVRPATVTSTAGDATLTVVDPSTTGAGQAGQRRVLARRSRSRPR